ncbi:MAG: hypothetical protein GXO80_03025 [Chlorobi bacterium]|nr:hypothetical protein [Chlorobiota bacterium]
MKILKTVIIFFYLLVVTGELNAQSTKDAASFPVPYQYGNIPVNLSTGAPNINIPLWTASSGNLTVPISASYNSNGLRSSDIPGIIGLQWNLNVGGSITQIVRGKNNLGVAENQDSIISPSTSFMGGVNSGHTDAEPDIYKVNAPGLSVDFMLAENNKVVQLTKSNVKIQYISLLQGFVITSEEGIKYYFNNRKIFSYQNTDDKSTFSYVWFLGKIENSDNTHFIIFKYTDQSDFGNNYIFCYGNNYTGTSTVNGVTSKEYAVTFTVLKFIKSVETENEIIYFNYFTPNNYKSPYPRYKITEIPFKNKKEIPPSPYFNRTEIFLENILIENKNEELNKKYVFNYYVNSYNRVFLNSITEKNNAGDSLPSYKFEYYDLDNTGEVFNRQTDYWGYYNPGATNLFPADTVPVGMIKKIYYPAGGFTKYFYEPNTYCFDTEETPWHNDKWKQTLFNNGFFSFYKSKNLRGGGYRIRKIEKHTENTVSSKIFDYSNDIIIDDTTVFTVSSGRLTSYPINSYSYFYYWNDDSDSISVSISSSNHLGIEQGYIAYEKISVYDEGLIYNNEEENFEYENALYHYRGKNGKTVYLYTMPTPVFYDNFPYILTVYPHNELGLLKEQTVYDKDNNIISKQHFNYSVTENQNNKRYGLKVIERSDSSFYNAKYAIIPKSIELLNKTDLIYATNGGADTLKNNIQYSYTRNNTERKYPVKISQTESNGDTLDTYLYYPEDFADSSELDPNGVYTEMIARNICSPVLKTEVYKNNKLVSGKKTNFNFVVTSDNKTLILPETTQIWEAGAYKTVDRFDKYTDKGNLLETHGIDSIYKAVIYNSEETKVIANVTNAKEDEIFHADFEKLTDNFSTNSYTGKYSKQISGTDSAEACAGVHDFDRTKLVSNKYTFSAWANTNSEGVKLILQKKTDSPNNPWKSYTIPNTGGKWKYFELTADIGTFSGTVLRCEVWANGQNALVDQVRFYPADAYMTTTTYKPLTGITSKTNTNGKASFYEYDKFGRLAKVFDQDKKQIKEFKYHIKE